MREIVSKIDAALAVFKPITLVEMSGIKLMNRIDTKYLINVNQLPILLERATADYFAQEIDGLRKGLYRTVYFDTSDAHMYTIHHNRKLNRQKVRIREYVESNRAYLEVKNKNNRGRTKKIRIPVDDEDVLDKIEAIEFINEKSNYQAEILSKRLKNSFFRITLVNKEKTERLTIDIQINFSNCITGVENGFPHLCIIEIKQDGNAHSPFKDYLADLRIKQKRISKYCLGMILTDASLKKNNFKRKLIYINKLLNHDIINTTE
jgi:hypothetical protein